MSRFCLPPEPNSCWHNRNEQVNIKSWELVATVRKSIPSPHSSFCHFVFPQQLGVEGKVEGFVGMRVKAATSEGHGVAAELGIEIQFPSRAAFLWCNCGG